VAELWCAATDRDTNHILIDGGMALCYAPRPFEMASLKRLLTAPNK